MDGEITTPESPRKRVKVADESVAASVPPVSSIEPPSPLPISGPPKAPVSENVEALKEAEVGITEFASPEISGFSGVFKKRFEKIHFLLFCSPASKTYCEQLN